MKERDQYRKTEARDPKSGTEKWGGLVTQEQCIQEERNAGIRREKTFTVAPLAQQRAPETAFAGVQVTTPLLPVPESPTDGAIFMRCHRTPVAGRPSSVCPLIP